MNHTVSLMRLHTSGSMKEKITFLATTKNLPSEKYRNFTWFPGVEILQKSKTARNYVETAFPKNFHTRKSGEITVFFAVKDVQLKLFWLHGARCYGFFYTSSRSYMLFVFVENCSRRNWWLIVFGTNKYWLQQFFQLIVYWQPFSPFSTTVPLLYSLKTSDFLMFSGGIEVKHWMKMT